MFSVLKRAAALWIGLASATLAQSNPNFPLNSPLGSTALNQAFVGKADTLNGVLTTPTINNGTLNSATLSGTIAGNPVFSGIVTLNQVQSFLTTGLLTINSGGGWSSFNVGKQLYVSTPANSSNPGIGIADSSGNNPWAIYNATGGIITLAAMPPLSDAVSPANVIAQFSTSGLAVTGSVSASTGFVANGTAGVTCAPGSPTASFQTVLGVVVHC